MMAWGGNLQEISRLVEFHENFLIEEFYGQGRHNKYYVKNITINVEKGFLIISDPENIIFDKTEFLGILLTNIESVIIEDSKYIIDIINEQKIIIYFL